MKHWINRNVRFLAQHPARLEAGGRTVDVVVRNITKGFRGVGLEATKPVEVFPGTKVKLHLVHEGLAVVMNGVVRWSKGGTLVGLEVHSVIREEPPASAQNPGSNGSPGNGTIGSGLGQSSYGEEVDDVKAAVEGYGMRVRLEKGFADALQAAKTALAEQGFGVLTEIDVRETLRKKTGEELGHEYVILGACNPSLAHRALSREKEIGLFLPCNLIVYEDGAAVVVSAVNPMVSIERVADPELEEIAKQATEKLRAAVEAIK